MYGKYKGHFFVFCVVFIFLVFSGTGTYISFGEDHVILVEDTFENPIISCDFIGILQDKYEMIEEEYLAREKEEKAILEEQEQKLRKKIIELSEKISEQKREWEELEKLAQEKMDDERNKWGVYTGQILYDTVQSHYCTCVKCCGSNGGTSSTTHSGLKIWIGMDNPFIVACNWLPLGSQVEINGQVYTVSDTGKHSRLKKIGGFDVFVPEGHKEATKRGLIYNTPITVVFING